jgi:outer membrane receptor protein involved in Fe transport
MLKSRNSLALLIVALLASFDQPSRSFGQTISPSPSPSTIANPSAAAAGQALQPIVVQGVSEETVNPLERPVSSIYGTDLPVNDIPRSVSSVTHEELQQQNITSIANLTQLTPSGSYLSRWGIIGTPTIRGDLAEVYVNGQRKLTNQKPFHPALLVLNLSTSSRGRHQ